MQNLRLIAFFLFSFASVLAAGSDKSSPLPQNNSPTQGVAAQLAKLSLSSNQLVYQFGVSVAISGNTVVVGTPYGNTNGAAYVYAQPSKGWTNLMPSAVLVASDAQYCDNFAGSVFISGDVVVVGASQNSCQPIGPGAAYVFVKPAGGWSGTLTETAKLTASDGATGDGIGTSVSISGSTIVAGAAGSYPYTTAGAAYVFVEPASGWINTTETAKLTANDGNLGDGLGTSVSISKDTVVAGAPQHGAGTAYVFVQPANGWASMTQTAELTSLPGTPNDGMGTSVAIDGDTLVAGAPYATVGANVSQGAAYIFSESSTGWSNTAEKANLIAPDGRAGDSFGSAVAISRNRIAIGAPDYSRGRILYSDYPVFWREGAVYAFRKLTNGSVNVDVMHGADSRYGDYLGTSVGMDGDLAIGGAPYFNFGRGVAYVFAVE